MECVVCQGKTSRRTVRKQHWLDGRLYIVDNVEAEVCKECGERYFHATVLDQIDSMILAEHEVKEVLNVELLSV